MMVLQQNFIDTFQMNQLLSFQVFMTPGESLTPWVLLIEEESYLPSGSYLGRITSRKRVGAQNEQHPNRDPNKTKVQQWHLWVMLTFRTHTGIPQKKFLSQKMFFFLLICLHLHLIEHIMKQTFVGKKFLQFHSLNFERIFNF